MKEGLPNFNEDNQEKIINGIKYRKIFTGYTIRQYFSHETPEKGPGPGWDSRWKIFEEYNVMEASDLPEEPYYIWEEVLDQQ